MEQQQGPLSPYPHYGSTITPPELVPGRPQPRGFAWIAWIIILIGVVVIVVGPMFVDEPAEEKAAKNDIAIMLMEFQGKFAVGAANQKDVKPSDVEMVYSQIAASAQKMGVDERQRLVVLAAELKGREEAAHQLDLINEDFAATAPAEDSGMEEATTEPGAGPNVSDSGTRDVQRVLTELYSSESGLESLTQDQRDLLVKELRWFGKLALAPAGSASQSERAEVIAPALKVYQMLNRGTLLAVLAGVLGFLGLVMMIILVAVRIVRSGMGRGAGPHGIYAETFAVWGVLFFGLQILAAIIAGFVPGYGLILIFIAFMSGLFALVWPVVRGIPWSEVRRDIGWTLGRNPVAEVALGPAGYVMGIPIFAVGILITLGLFVLQQIISGGDGESAEAPSHPMIQQLFEGSLTTYLQLLLLGSVAAPIVEETMFRGVLYRHLRDATGRWHMLLSILVSMAINSFIFAVIHPQGWIAVPALGALAINFTLMREWRGTLLPSMIMHAIQNGLVFTALFLVMRQN